MESLKYERRGAILHAVGTTSARVTKATSSVIDDLRHVLQI